MINEQEGLYTLYLRGSENGQKVDDKRVISSVSRCLNPYEKAGYEAMMELAASDELEIIVSNTTEAGIQYDPSCKKMMTAHRQVFPGKTDTGAVPSLSGRKKRDHHVSLRADRQQWKRAVKMCQPVH